jgi:sugar phosphate isomerase/epimerase
VLRFLEDIGAPNAALHLDTYHMNIDEPGMAAAIETAGEETRLRLLISRHIEYGKAPDFARDWVMRSDQRNAELVATTQSRADALIRIG